MDAENRRSKLLTRREVVGTAGAAAAAGGLAWSTRPAWGATGALSSARQLSPPMLDAPPAAGAWVELDRGAVAANLAAVRAQSGGRPVMGVIKANGYGHGLVPFARLLVEAGVDALMVITVDEALAIREAGIETPLLNYGPFDPRAAEELVRQRIDQAVYTTDAIDGMAAAARRVGEPARLQVILDTGLGRIGVPYAGGDTETDAFAMLAAAAEAIGRQQATIAGTATALTEDPEFDRIQTERFERFCAVAGERGIDVGTRHVASSAAVLDYPQSHLDMVRPGIMLFGHYPNDQSLRERPIELTPVMSLKAKVAYVKTLQAGDSIGYHQAWVAERPTTVATLPIGHFEGYPTAALAAGGAVAIRGRACPLIGGVTSNHVEVAIPEGLDVEIGDVATLIAGGAEGAGSYGDPPTPGEPKAWLPTAPQVGEWGGAGIYGVLMHVSPVLPRVLV